MASLTFLGAAGAVTGSKYLIEDGGRRVLVDCGLFQGEKVLRQRNWLPLPVPARSIEAVVLTHAHVDHSGALPRLVREGFGGPIYATSGTADLCALLLPDSAHLQEEEARYANQEGYSKHRPALPLYTAEDAARALERFETFGYARRRWIAPGFHATFTPAGHLLGSASVAIEIDRTGQTLVFSGDLGRSWGSLLRPPGRPDVEAPDALLCEATYGDRLHPTGAPKDGLARAVNETAARGGTLLIPAFAIGRTQDLLFALRELEAEGRIPVLDVFVDSPMACDATPIYLAHREDHGLPIRSVLARGGAPFSTRKTHFANTVAQSKAINDLPGPLIVLSASGMATGGRVVHHLRRLLPDPKNRILFSGYQAAGTRGRRLLNGEPTLRIFGQPVPVRAEVGELLGFSAHADRADLARWLDGFKTPPKQTFLVHGERGGLDALSGDVRARGWAVQAPDLGQRFEL